MATAEAQRKWRDRNRFVKTQLNVMARRETHTTLDEVADAFGLKGKGEAVTLACFLVRALRQRAEYSPEAARILEDVAEGYRRNRDLFCA